MIQQQTEQATLQADQAQAKQESMIEIILILSAVFGFLFVSVGAYLIYAPSGFIVAGVLLLAFAITVAVQLKGASQ